jgi:hypothetical protein
MLTAYLSAMPYGSAAGEPCLELHTDVPASYDEALDRRRRILAAIAGLGGVASFWLPTAPWGEPHCDERLLPLIQEVATVRATLDVFSDKASGLLITQIIDATRVLAQPVDPSGLRRQLASRLLVPRADEVVLLGTCDDNLTAAHLDVVTEFLATAGVEPAGFLYVAPEQLEAALVATAKAGTVWRVGDIRSATPMRVALGVS